MAQQFALLEEQHLIFLAVIAGLILIAATIVGSVIAVQFRKLRQREFELGFKDELLLRGYTVDETIRLLTSRKPGWSSSLIQFGDWMSGNLKTVGSELGSFMRQAAADCSRLAQRVWKQAGPHLEQLRQQSGPWLQSAVTRVSRGIHWLTDKTEDAARRLVTPRP